MIISLIVAASENNVIGRDNQLPWHLPDDLAFFKEKTRGHPIIMGRKNFESIGRVLPDRKSIVITRQADWQHEGCTVVHSLEDALRAAGDVEEAFVIGGGEIFRQAMERADRIYLTRVHAEVEGDVMFPEISDEWKEVSRRRHAADERHPFPFTFLEFHRKNRG